MWMCYSGLFYLIFFLCQAENEGLNLIQLALYPMKSEMDNSVREEYSRETFSYAYCTLRGKVKIYATSSFEK